MDAHSRLTALEQAVAALGDMDTSALTPEALGEIVDRLHGLAAGLIDFAALVSAVQWYLHLAPALAERHSPLAGRTDAIELVGLLAEHRPEDATLH